MWQQILGENFALAYDSKWSFRTLSGIRSLGRPAAPGPATSLAPSQHTHNLVPPPGYRPAGEGRGSSLLCNNITVQ